MKMKTVSLMLLLVVLASTLSTAVAYQYYFVSEKKQISVGLIIKPSEPVPEFPLGLTLEILFIPVIIYILWRSKQREKVLP